MYIAGNIPSTTAAFAQAQTPLFNYIIPISVNVRKRFNIIISRNEERSIISCIKLGNSLVFTDYLNNRLTISNLEGTDIHHHHIILNYGPRYITAIGTDTVAVSCTFNRNILIINISTGSVSRTINTSDIPSYGLSYVDNNLYVVIGKKLTHMMDLTGKVIRTIQLPSRDIHDITVGRNSLVCINCRSIYYCSLDGYLIWKFKNEKYTSLRRVTTDDEGKVYVTDAITNTVVVVEVSEHGKHYKEVLTYSDGINDPCGIYFDKKDKTLLVCNVLDAEVFLSDVKKKLVFLSRN